MGEGEEVSFLKKWICKQIIREGHLIFCSLAFLIMNT